MVLKIEEEQEDLGSDDGGEDNEPSLRDTLDEAIEEIEGADDGEKASKSDDDDSGGADEQAGSDEKSGEDLGAEGSGSDSKSDDNTDSEAAGAETNEESKAPASWKPEEKEAWKDLPKSVQTRITAREAENDTLLRETAQARRTHDIIGQFNTGYSQLLASEGAPDVFTGIKGMFDTVALLANGSQTAKATKVAQMIKHYGIDINTLDAVLVGEKPENSQTSELEQMIETRMKPVNNLMKMMENNQNSQRQTQVDTANSEVAAFQGEFLSEVRNDMADLIDMAAARGEDMSLQDAYDKAVMLRDDLTKIISARKNDDEILGKKNSMNSKTNAASSVSGHRSGTSSKTGDSLRSAIADAWDEG